jgi:hypothetical protein
MICQSNLLDLRWETLARALHSQVRAKEALNQTCPEGTGCVRKSTDSWFCNSQWFSQFAAFFIVTKAEISIAEVLV